MFILCHLFKHVKWSSVIEVDLNLRGCRFDSHAVHSQHLSKRLTYHVLMSTRPPSTSRTEMNSSLLSVLNCLHCFDIVGWVSGRASGL